MIDKWYQEFRKKVLQGWNYTGNDLWFRIEKGKIVIDIVQGGHNKKSIIKTLMLKE